MVREVAVYYLVNTERTNGEKQIHRCGTEANPLYPGAAGLFAQNCDSEVQTLAGDESLRKHKWSKSNADKPL
jgi:hypothetical protein